MEQAKPVVYILHGDDEYAIAQSLQEMESRVGDAATASMNVTRLDGRAFNPEELMSVTSAMPFLAKRRLVILNNPLARLTAKASQERFINHLSQIPDTTALVLVIDHTLADGYGRDKAHWLINWANTQSGRALVKNFALPKGAAMADWLLKHAKTLGGQMSREAAELLAAYVDADTRLADMEVQKLLLYVNQERPVEPEDVELLCADNGQGDIFALVDALSARDGRRSQALLHRLLEVDDPMRIFAMIVRQFRLLLLAREILDQGGQVNEVARQLHLAPFVAEKVTRPARQLALGDLELLYHRLLATDEAAKSSTIEWDVALDLLVAGFTTR